MFGKKKKKYLKKFDPPSSIESSQMRTHSSRDSSHRNNRHEDSVNDYFKQNKRTPGNQRKHKSNINSDDLFSQDFLLLKKERINSGDQTQYKADCAVVTTQKSAKKVLLIICLILSFKYLGLLMKASFLNNNETFNTFLFLIPLVAGIIFIYFGVFHIWANYLQPVHRVTLRKIFPYWKWLLLIFYIAYIRNLFSSITGDIPF